MAITATIENRGEFQAEEALTVRADGEVIASDVVILDRGAIEAVEFTFESDIVGAYSTAANEEAVTPDQLTVHAGSPSADDADSTLWLGS